MIVVHCSGSTASGSTAPGSTASAKCDESAFETCAALLPETPTLREALFSHFVVILSVFLCERERERARAHAREGEYMQIELLNSEKLFQPFFLTN